LNLLVLAWRRISACALGRRLHLLVLTLRCLPACAAGFGHLRRRIGHHQHHRIRPADFLIAKPRNQAEFHIAGGQRICRQNDEFTATIRARPA